MSQRKCWEEIERKQKRTAVLPLCCRESRWNIVFLPKSSRWGLSSGRSPLHPLLCLTRIPADLLAMEVLLSGLRFQKAPKAAAWLANNEQWRWNVRSIYIPEKVVPQLIRTGQGHPLYQHWAALMNVSIVEAVPATQRGKFLTHCFLASLPLLTKSLTWFWLRNHGTK